MSDIRAVDAELFDLEGSLAQLEGDRDLLVEIAGLFLEDAPALWEGVTRSVAGGDPEGLRRAAHTLKGAAANLGSSAVARGALVLERIGRDRDFGPAADAVRRLRADLDRLEAVLESLVGGAAA
jgi:HPt (histidine-containing phosphotransfer) domain-containing protein